MILADTSVWIDHLRNNNVRLAHWLEHSQILTHALVIGELAIGSLKPDHETIKLMRNLPQTISATDEEVLTFIAHHNLSGLGIGLIDAHLLAATALTADARLWTLDGRLHEAAVRLGLAA
jgi:predicted nucleic acid-binding protein